MLLSKRASRKVSGAGFGTALPGARNFHDCPRLSASVRASQAQGKQAWVLLHKMCDADMVADVISLSAAMSAREKGDQ